jgi:hypothetical protein
MPFSAGAYVNPKSKPSLEVPLETVDAAVDAVLSYFSLADDAIDADFLDAMATYEQSPGYEPSFPMSDHFGL